MRTEEKIIENYTDIPALLKNCGARRPFLCCGKSFEKTDAFAYLQAHCRLTVWDTVRPNPRYEDMVAAAELYRKEGCDFIIGAGGGSPLDSAKMIKLLITNPGVVGYDTELRDNDIPFLAIPTTSGTGSEATRYSIFYVNEDEKHSVSHPGFLPGYVLLDPCFLQTVPDYQRKCTCLDALCHAIECFTSNKANPFSDLFALQALDMILNNIEKACDDPAAMAEKNAMLLASFYAGVAITASGTTAVHALSYPLGGKYHIAHGVSNAMLLVPVMRFNESACREKFAAAYDRCVHAGGGCATVEEKSAWIIRRLEEIVRHLDIPTSLAQFGVPGEDLEVLVEAGMGVQRLLVNNMREVTPADARAIYTQGL